MWGFGAETLIYAVIFVSVMFLVEGIYLLVFGKSISLNNRINRRLDMMEKGAARQEVLEQLRKEMSQHLSTRKIPLYSVIAKKAQIANIAFKPQQLVMMMGFLAAAAFVGMTVGTTASFPIRLIVSPLMGVGAVYFWVNGKAKKRIGMMEEQLPDAIELMVRSLKVGHPFSSAIAAVATESPDPIGTEFGVIADEAAYGGDLTESLQEMAERLDMQDLRFLAVAVGIQAKSGGNLAEILAGLAAVIRSRFRLFRKVAAITAEAKFSGFFLSAFPILALIGMLFTKPDFYDEVMETTMFVPAVIIVAFLLIINIVFMRVMTNIKV